MSRNSTLTAALVLLWLTVAYCGARGDKLTAAGPEQLTAEERTAVRNLAEQTLKERGLLKGKVYLTRIDVYCDSDREERHAIAIHYRYEGDLAILTHIDLGTMKVTEVEPIAHLPASLAPEELVEAEKLARANREVARALARHANGPKIEVGAQLAITAVPDAPTYHHRVVRLFFRRGREFLLYMPNVDVDLTAGTVRVQPAGQGH